MFIPAMALMSVWWAYKQGIIGLADLRVWLACHELVARRCGVRGKRRPRFVEHEILGLTVVTCQKAKSSLRRLERTGFVRWTQTAVHLGDGTTYVTPEDRTDLDHLAEVIVNHRRKVPVPRRLLRILCRTSRPVLIATAFGHLLRCMYYRNGECCPDGRCKSSWVAGVFGVDIRNVKAARGELVRSGWLIMEPTDQRSMNRWGPRVRVNLDWQSVSALGKHKSPPPALAGSPQSPPPKKDRKLSTRSVNQKPAGAAQSGVESQQHRSFHVRPEDLHDLKRLDVLLAESRRCGWVAEHEAARLQFHAAAAHAVRVGKQNPPGLFAAIIRNGLWSFVSGADEDLARRRLTMSHNTHAGQRFDQNRARSTMTGPMPVGAILDSLLPQLRANRMRA